MFSFGLRGRSRGAAVAGEKRPRAVFDESDERGATHTKTGAGDRGERSNVDEDDALDAFMHEISQKEEKATRQPERSLDDEEDDPVTSFAEAREVRPRGNLNGNGSDDGEESDSENPRVQRFTLDPVDHTTVDYIAIRKNLWIPGPRLSQLNPDAIAARRQDRNLTVSSDGLPLSDLPPPLETFGEAGASLGPRLLHAISLAGYEKPTEIQSQAIPAALGGHDIIGTAKTGSGKTAAFVLPMLVAALDQPHVGQSEGPIGLILAPTRELALQIGSECEKFGRVVNVHATVIVGGQSKFEQYKRLRDKGAECVVATPGRMMDMLKMKACSLRRVSYLVLDEADRMLDLGFERQVRALLSQIRPDRQVLFFSATFKKSVESLARSCCSANAVRIIVGQVGEVNENIDENFKIFDSANEKLEWLKEWLAHVKEQSVVVFATTKASCAQLANSLRGAGFPTASIHGETQQDDREGMMRMFRRKDVSILVATDLAARGLDIKGVAYVVNYDTPTRVDWYTHRIGRTGRAGQKGIAYTCLLSSNDKDRRFAVDLAEKYRSSRRDAPAALGQFARSFRPTSRARGSRRGRPGLS